MIPNQRLSEGGSAESRQTLRALFFDRAWRVESILGSVQLTLERSLVMMSLLYRLVRLRSSWTDVLSQFVEEYTLIYNTKQARIYKCPIPIPYG